MPNCTKENDSPRIIPITIFNQPLSPSVSAIFGLRFGRHQFAHDDLWWLPPNEVLVLKTSEAEDVLELPKLEGESLRYYIPFQEGYT